MRIKYATELAKAAISWFLNKKVKYNVESTWQSFVIGRTKCMFEHIVRRRLVDDELPAPLVTLVCSVTTLTVQSPSILIWRPSRALCVTSGHFDLKCTNYSQMYLGGAKNPWRPPPLPPPPHPLGTFESEMSNRNSKRTISTVVGKIEDLKQSEK